MANPATFIWYELVTQDPESEAESCGALVGIDRQSAIFDLVSPRTT